MFRKVKTRSWCSYSALFGSVNRLITLFILWFNISGNIFWDRCLPQFIQFFSELFVSSVIEETQRTTTRGCIVNDFRHQRFVFAKIQFVSYSYLSGWINQNVPQALLFVQFS